MANRLALGPPKGENTVAWPWHVHGGKHGRAALEAHRGGGEGRMVVRWLLEAMARGSSVVLNRYGVEDNWGAIFFSGELRRLQRARLLSSLLLLPHFPPLGHCGGSSVAIEWRRGVGGVLGHRGCPLIGRP